MKFAHPTPIDQPRPSTQHREFSRPFDFFDSLPGTSRQRGLSSQGKKDQQPMQPSRLNFAPLREIIPTSRSTKIRRFFALFVRLVLTSCLQSINLRHPTNIGNCRAPLTSLISLPDTLSPKKGSHAQTPQNRQSTELSCPTLCALAPLREILPTSRSLKTRRFFASFDFFAPCPQFAGPQLLATATDSRPSPKCLPNAPISQSSALPRSGIQQQ